MTKHSVDFRVYYEDTDSGGVVYHARYLHFAERGRTELLRSLGYENQKIRDEKGLVFVVRNLDIHFIKPARLDDMLTVQTGISNIKNSSFEMNQRIIRGEDSISDINVFLVCVKALDFRPVRMPDDVRAAFLKYQETTK